MDTITTTQPPVNLKTLPQPPPSIAELRHISAALSQFLRDYDDLHNHIGFVNSAIDEKLSVHFEGIAVNVNDFELTPLIDSTNNNSVRNVLEGSVVERNPKVNVSECLFSDDDNVLECVVSEQKRNECVVDDDDNSVLEGVVSERKRNECVVDDDVRMHASSDSFIKDSDNFVVNDVLEGKGEGTESEYEQSDEGLKNYEKNDCDGVVEGVVVMEGKCEGSVSESESESERSYEDMRMYESDCAGVLEGVVVMEGKYEGSVSESESEGEQSESESEGERSEEDMRMYESDCDGVVNDVLEGVVVTEGKCEGSVSENESECERSDEDLRMYESDCDRVVNDVLEGDVLEEKPKGDESDFKGRNEDVKMEESDCAKIITDVPKAVVSDESSKGTVIECEQSDDDVKMCESPKYSTSCEETDDEGEEIDATNNADDEGEKIDAAKNVEETDYDRAINEFLEEIAVIEKNPIRTASKCDKVRMPQSSSSLENTNSEETDDEDGEIEASKKPEDADYDRIVTELLEDIDVVPKPNRTASDSDESFDKPQSPTSSKNSEETDVSMNPDDTDISKNHRETAVSMEPGEIDILNDPVETDVSEKHDEIDIPANPVETDVSEKPEEIDTAKNPEETDVLEKPENVEILKDPKPAVSELERLCKSMSGREMKKYVVKHISDIDKLQKELLKALKLAINPAKLVLDSIDTHFLQSGKTYNRGSYQYLNDQIGERQASVLILECFVIISGDEIKISRRNEGYAAKTANRWKNRMIKEGGLKKIEEADARGLLLLISGFGIIDRHFKIVDIMDLMMASNVKGISNILRRSIVLMPKIPEVIDTMVMKKLEVEAADLAYTFGLEDKCHALTILKKFLRNISGSPVQLEATKQQLDDLISVKECLESHNIDPSKVLPEFKIAEKIHRLKKELKLRFPVQKRKAMDIESLPNPNHQEAKRACSSHKTMPRGISSYNQSMQPGYSYHDFNPNLSSNYVTAYSSSSLLNAPALPVNITNSVPSGLAGPGGNIRPYGWQDDSDCSELVEKYLPRQSQTYDSQPYDCQDDSALVEKYLPRHSQTYDSQPSSTGLLGRRPGFPVCMPGHPGYPGYFPSGGFPARRGPGSDLYGFADVVEKERRGPGSDLYGFADVVEKERRGSRAVGSGTARY